MQHSHYSPLRYPGGKQALAPFFGEIIKLNNLEGGSYIEPFAGGAGAALNLLFTEKIYKIVLNDIDHHLYCFWKSILSETTEFIKLIENSKVDIIEYNKQREILNGDISKFSILEKGFSAFFLNRCNRSGILNAGPIGGKAQSGEWKIDVRFNKIDLIERIDLISDYEDRIEVFNLDALDFLDKYITHLPLKNQNVLVYLDPPYYIKGNELYRNSYKKNDHIEFSEYFRKLENFRWLISYDDSEFIRNLFASKNHGFVNFNYFANQAKVGRELMIFSDDCILPDRYRILDDQSLLEINHSWKRVDLLKRDL